MLPRDAHAQDARADAEAQRRLEHDGLAIDAFIVYALVTNAEAFTP